MRIWGLDIGSTGVKAVEISRSWQGERVTNCWFRPIHPANKEDFRKEVLQALQEIFAGREKGERTIILPIPSHRTMIHRGPVPFRDRKRNLQVIKFEVEPFLPLPIDQVVVDYYPLKEKPSKEKGEGPDALIFAVRKEEIEERLALLREAGLDPESIVPEAVALFSLMKYTGENISTGSGALLDVGHEKTTLIIWAEGRLTMARAIPIAGCTLTAPSNPGENSPFARLADEVQRSIIAYEAGDGVRAVENIFLTGGGAALPNISRILGERTHKPLALLEMGEKSSLILREVPQVYQSILPVALGAALAGTSGEADRINFRQEEFSSSRRMKKKKGRRNLLCAYSAILILLGAVAFFGNLYLQEKKYGDLKAEIRREFLQANPGVRNVVNEVQQMRMMVRDETARLAALGGKAGTGSPLEVIRELSLLVEPAWKVRITDLLIGTETIELDGEADTFDTVNRVKAKLDQSPFFKDVQLKAAKASTLQNIVEFKLQMGRRSEG